MPDRPTVTNPVLAELAPRDPGLNKATGTPVLVGEVQSSRVQGSSVWSPTQNESENRLFMGTINPADAPTGTEPYLIWRAAGQPNDDTGYRMLVGPYAGYFDLIMLARESGGKEAAFYVAPGPTTAQWGFRYDDTNRILFEYDGTRTIANIARLRTFCQVGTGAFALSAASEGSGTFNFDETFSATPRAYIAGTDDREFNAAVESVSTTQITIGIEHIAGTAVTKTVNVWWFAAGAQA